MAGLVECRTATEVFENFKAVRARLRQLKSPEPPPSPPPLEPVVHKIEITETPQETIVMVHVQEPEPTRVHKHPSVDRIVRAVCEKYKVNRADLLSQRRSQYIVRPRQIAMYLARMLTLRSLPAIGRAIGGRDHTSVLHGVQKITRLRAAFKDHLDEELSELESILGAPNVD